MKVVQILPELNGGSVEQGTLEFAQELVQMGHESVVISAGGALVSRLTLRGSQHIQLPIHKKSLWSLRLVGRLRRLIFELNPDVVHVHSPRFPAWLTWLALRGLPGGQRPCFVITVHGLNSVGFYSAVMSRSEGVIAVSQWVADNLSKYHSAKLRQPPAVIHRGVNTKEFDRDAPVSGHWQLKLMNSFPQLEGKNWLLMPAELAPGKGHKLFLQILAKISAQRDDVFGLVVGAVTSGNEKYARELEHLALEQGLSDKVVFLGQRRDMRELYASSQITYSLSGQAEPFEQTVSEALAMNCPVVAFSDGGPAEVLQSCFPQGLVERGNIDELVETSLKILNHAEPINFAGFSLREMSQKVLTIYEGLLHPEHVPVINSAG